MLAELSIKNFAIIESISISFEKGLTVLTGETGAGKSIIIDAIHLLIGGRGSSEFVRHGCSRAEIEGLFLLEDKRDHPCIPKAKDLGIDIEDGMVVIRRDISKNGKSICRINGKLVTLGILREIGQTLIDIHGQHETQDLMDSDRHITLLDQFNNQNISRGKENYLQIYKQYETLKKKLGQLNENEQEMAHRLDLIQFQLGEIKKADLKPNEDENLLEEKFKLSNYEKVFSALTDSYQSLYGERKGLDWVGLAMGHLEEVAELDESIKKLSEMVTTCYYNLEEVSYGIRDQLDNMEFDPQRLDFIESRLNEISFLKKKYGHSVTDILEYAAKIEDEIDTITNRDSHINLLSKEVTELSKDLIIEGKNLSDLRKKTSLKLIEAIHQELRELYMEKTKFEVDLKIRQGKSNDPEFEGQHIQFRENGIDEIEFMISTNPGEPLKPLSKVASGGELSRIMLALKSIFSKHQGVTSIIFDEVDTGVSGRVAQAIAEKIYKVSSGSQVLCITHLPQVAAMSDTHLYISKQIEQERTKTSVTPLFGDERIKEIARMISGVEITNLTKQHSKELLDMAEAMKTGYEKLSN